MQEEAREGDHVISTLLPGGWLGLGGGVCVRVCAPAQPRAAADLVHGGVRVHQQVSCLPH